MLLHILFWFYLLCLNYYSPWNSFSALASLQKKKPHPHHCPTYSLILSA